MFKILSDNKTNKNQVHVDKAWKVYMAMPEEQTMKRGTNEPIIADKNMLIEILEELQRDNLIMFEPSDGTVILI